MGGIVRRVLVYEKDVVKRGDLLATIDDSEMRASLSEAEARVAEAEADVRLFDAEANRARDLWRKEVGSLQDVERRQRDLDAARSRVATARAETARLRAVLAKTRIVAPIDGGVVRRNVDPGEAIEARRPVATIADVSRLRVEAEVDEFDAARIRMGAPVTVTAEGYAGQRWNGLVEEIPDTVEPRRLIAQDPSRATDAAVLLVKIAFSSPTPLKLGQRVDVAVR
jgi:RND family efflux transporter MFP subunit